MPKPAHVRPFHFQLVVDLLTAIAAGTAPADQVMHGAFREHRQMGGRDRGLVAETVYHVLRHRRRLARLAGSDAATALAAAAWLELGLVDSDTLTRFGFTGDARAIAHAVNEGLPTDAPFADRASLPDWLADALSQQFGEIEAAALADALNRPAPVDLRVNPLKTTREALVDLLAASGHPAVPTPWSPQGLRREDRAPLFNLQAFREGLFEVQDEGSQFIGLLTDPRPGERVLDLCAGAGGKTLHLGALMQGRGSIVACDVSKRRLDQLKPRLARAGLSNVRLMPIRDENDARLKRLRDGFDRVLVDAPCSGTGTLRRNPDIKWRALELNQLLHTQAALLDAAAKLVKPGGRLVYATCSLLDAENTAQIDDFLTRHPEFRRMPVADILRDAGIDWPVDETDLRLLPHRHGTDGFYAALLECMMTTGGEPASDRR